MLDSGKSHDQTDSYLFLKKEIPTRLANMIMELKLLPEDLLKQKECAEILDDYITSFKYEEHWVKLKYSYIIPAGKCSCLRSRMRLTV